MHTMLFMKEMRKKLQFNKNVQSKKPCIILHRQRERSQASRDLFKHEIYNFFLSQCIILPARSRSKIRIRNTADKSIISRKKVAKFHFEVQPLFTLAPPENKFYSIAFILCTIHMRLKNFVIFSPRDADPGCLYRIPGSDFFSSRIRIVSIPDPGSASKRIQVF